MSLKGKHALVTGSSRGIGRGIALKLAEQGAKVAVHYFQNEKAAKETLVEVRKRGSDGFMLQADVTRIEGVSSIFAKVKSEFGKLDIFVANARPEAPQFFAPPMDITTEQWDAAFNSQAKGFLVSLREAAALMPSGGRILAMAYHAGSVTGGLQPWVAMGPAKAAMESLVRYFAVAMARRGITVNAISPGWTEDSVLNSLPSEVQEMVRKWHQRGWTPMGRLGTPEDIGNVVAMFCSEQSAWITGQIICADGGSSLMNPEIPTEMQM
ncbi:MAG: SDR family oxidoreductase [Mycobacterium sp.]|jgi:NAD(P)-dependent dehydrogenase (short-subunit alcohol dehydrogenase family)|nr:SDR family oxidoreductase [Mycobacterium sp.]